MSRMDEGTVAGNVRSISDVGVESMNGDVC